MKNAADKMAKNDQKCWSHPGFEHVAAYKSIFKNNVNTYSLNSNKFMAKWIRHYTGVQFPIEATDFSSSPWKFGDFERQKFMPFPSERSVS